MSRLVIGVSLTSAVVLAVSGCSSASSAGLLPQAGGTTTAIGATGAVQGPSATQTGGPSPTGTVAPPLPNPMKSVAKVKRSGAPKSPTVSAPTAAFTSAVVYPDGVKVSITKATMGIEQGHGPGVFAGREYVLLTMTLTNGTAKAINLNQVVVTTTYGKSSQLAPPVYTEGAGARDFGGTVAAGASTTAAYAFAVPVKQLNDVTTVVDFDGVHTSATYRGLVKAS